MKIRMLLTIFATVGMLGLWASHAAPLKTHPTISNAESPELERLVEDLGEQFAPAAKCSAANLFDCDGCCWAAIAKYNECRTQKLGGGSTCDCIAQAVRFCGVECGSGPCECCLTWERAWNTQNCTGTK